MTDNAKGFIILKSHVPGIELLTREQKGLLLEALIADLMGDENQITDPVVNAVFVMMLPSIRGAQSAYDRKAQVARENGKLGGRPQKPTQTEKTDLVNNNPVGFCETEKTQNRIELNRIEENRIDIKEENIPPLSPKGDIPPQGGRTRKEDPKMEYGRFEKVLLSEKEFLALQDKFGIHGTQERIDRLDAYIASTGKKYKSHYATILNWENREMSNKPSNVPRPITVGQQRQQERQVMARMLLEDGDRRRAEEMRDAHGNRVVTQPDGTQLTLPPGW